MDHAAAARAIEAFLIALGHDPKGDPDLQGTPERVAEAWIEDLLDGSAVDVSALLAAESFPLGGGTSSQLVVLRDSAVATVCPHHLLPALGFATNEPPPARLLARVNRPYWFDESAWSNPSVPPSPLFH